MSRARLLLHLAALVLPVLAAGALMLSVFFKGADEFFLLAGVAVVAAQLAVLPGWWLLDRSARRRGWIRPALAGLAMALLTHLLSGVVMELWVTLSGAGPERAGLAGLYLRLQGVLLVAGLSCAFVGWATAPAVMLLCVLLQRRRRAELAGAADLHRLADAPAEVAP
ncbi:hypothetical protein [Tahibacter harae]|uniref:Uncharacterized protein n=1 Tax=Tahibacter harae TaxID=2963937 RepID=A0ABT1QX72_9GAMM|nr:hypothetical protein [Tahibacter harae]MCQ4166878.1 hypothetical protein [Tahibacter harae]